MASVRTYIDSNVLIYALRGDEDLSARARAFLFDPLREYVSSDYVRVELLPKCVYHQNEEERLFYEEFFTSSAVWVPSSDDLLALAIEEGGRTGISGMDAVHVACAIVANASELITAEKSTKPMFRSVSVKVISIRPDGDPDDASATGTQSGTT